MIFELKNKKKNKNRNSIIIIALGLVVCVLTGCVIFLIYKNCSDTNNLLTASLVETNNFKAYNIQNYLTEKINELNNFAKNEVIVSALKEYEQAGQISEETIISIDVEFAEFGWASASLLNKDAIILASTKKQEIGFDYSKYSPKNITEKEFFLIYYNEISQTNMLGLVKPVIESGKLLGGVAADVDLAGLAGVTMSPAENASDFAMETFVIDKNGILITPSKFMGQNSGGGTLVQEIKGDIAEKCFDLLDNPFAIEEKTVYKYTNYLGNQVLGIINVILDSEWCVITEFNKNN
jgi:hypothetical protein